jgi:protein TonB
MTLAPSAPQGPRRPYRPPIGIPTPKQSRAAGAIASIILHAIIIFLLIGPVIAHDFVVAQNEGAGGKGPRGGGGGGNRGGAQAERERAQYVEIAPPPPVTKSTQPQLVTPPVVRPPEPQIPQPPTPDPVPAAPAPPATAPSSGTGGTGSDGSGGTGPGSGGGVGSGVGTGRGSGNGAGTGGGTGRVYPPQVTHLALLPMPVPSKVKPYTLIATFEVDETGKGKLLHFNESKDSNYNKKIRAMLEEIRFRPAVRADGTPVRDTAQVIAEARL